MRRYAWALALIIFLNLLSLAFAQEAKRGPATDEERRRAVAAARAFEANPLAKEVQSEREWAIRFLIEVPDIHIVLCSDAHAYPWITKDGKKYRYASELSVAIMLSSGAFVIEHPELANDSAALMQAAVESSLKVYEGILAADPKANFKPLDEFLQERKNGELPVYLQQIAGKNCGAGKAAKAKKIQG